MKKTCERCKALEDEFRIGFRCGLGHKINVYKGIPLEECEKPITYSEYVDISLAKSRAASNNKFEPTRE